MSIQQDSQYPILTQMINELQGIKTNDGVVQSTEAIRQSNENSRQIAEANRQIEFEAFKAEYEATKFASIKQEIMSARNGEANLATRFSKFDDQLATIIALGGVSSVIDGGNFGETSTDVYDGGEF